MGLRPRVLKVGGLRIYPWIHGVSTRLDWSLMIDEMSSSNMVDKFQEMITNLVDIHLPLKNISISPYDRPWMTEEVKNKKRTAPKNL